MERPKAKLMLMTYGGDGFCWWQVWYKLPTNIIVGHQNSQISTIPDTGSVADQAIYYNCLSS